MRSIKLTLILIVSTTLFTIASAGLSNVLFNKKANASALTFKEKVIGLSLVGQQFTKPYYFKSRPSFNDCDCSSSEVSNKPYFSEAIVESTRKEKTLYPKDISLNQITMSGSGLDPHITHSNAVLQARKISNYTGIKNQKILDLVEDSSRKRVLGIYGEKITNVLELNLKIREIYAPKI